MFCSEVRQNPKQTDHPLFKPSSVVRHMKDRQPLYGLFWKHVKGVLAFPRGLGVLAERAVRVLCRQLAARLSKVETARSLAEPL